MTPIYEVDSTEINLTRKGRERLEELRQMNDREQERRDNELMQLGGLFDSPIPGLNFVVPTACTGTTNKGDDTKAPGVWLRNGKRANDRVSPEHAERLLTMDEALAYARGIDKIARPHGQSGHRPVEGHPQNYEALVAAFYETLGRRLDRAITKAEDRRSELREARAALTGRTG